MAESSRPLLASHPVYDYLAARYNLNLTAVLWEPDAYPSDAMWRDLTRVNGERGAKWMLWESEPLEQTRSRLAAMGIRCVVFDPCGNIPGDGDFMSVMQNNIDGLRDVFSNP